MSLHVASIVVSWNRRALLLECLASLSAVELPPGFTHRPVVVDNGSTDGSLEAVANRFPTCDRIALPHNVGFAAGVNAGLRRALAEGADWTLLVNNDATIAPDMLRILLAAAAEADAGRVPGRAGTVALLAPTIRRHDAPHHVWPSAGWRRALTLKPIDTTASPPRTTPYDVDWANGCVVLVRRRLWTTVGLFDERFRFYYEDHDLSLRARSAGLRLLHVPAAGAWHRVAGTTGEKSPRQRYLLARGSVPFFARHTHGPQRLLILPYRMMSLLRQLLTVLARGDLRGARALLRGIAHGVGDLRRGAPPPGPLYLGGTP